LAFKIIIVLKIIITENIHKILYTLLFLTQRILFNRHSSFEKKVKENNAEFLRRNSTAVHKV